LQQPENDAAPQKTPPANNYAPGAVLKPDDPSTRGIAAIERDGKGIIAVKYLCIYRLCRLFKFVD